MNTIASQIDKLSKQIKSFGEIELAESKNRMNLARVSDIIKSIQLCIKTSQESDRLAPHRSNVRVIRYLAEAVDELNNASQYLRDLSNLIP